MISIGICNLRDHNRVMLRHQSMKFPSGTDNVQKKTGNGFGKMNSSNAPEGLEQSKKKLKLVKKIAKVINPLICVLYVIFYFIYFIIFFSQ